MTALRFCMLTTFYPPYSFGGDGIGIQRLSRALVRQGHHVTVVHDADAYRLLQRGPLPDLPEERDDEGVRVLRLQTRFPALATLAVHQLGRPVAHASRLRSLLAEGRWDVVNFHNISLVGGPGLIGFAQDAVTLYMAHEHWLVCPTHVLWRNREERCETRSCLSCVASHGRPPQLWRYTGALDRALDKVDTIIAMSEFSRDKHREFGLRQSMEVLPYFLPPQASGDAAAARGAAERPHPRPFFLFVGRLEKIKGLDDVLPVFRDYPDADLLIAGDGEHAEVLRAAGRSIERVHFLGRIAPEALEPLYRNAIALLVPSVCYETFGIVLLEAMRQGTPVIARRLGPFPEILERAGAGELFESPDELVQAMRRLQADPPRRAELARRGVEAVEEHWSESAVVPRYLGIVHRAAARRGLTHITDTLSAAEVA